MATFQRRGGKWRAIIRRKGESKSRTFPTKAAAQEWARRIEHELDTGLIQDFRTPGQLLVRELIDDYRKSVHPVRPFGRSKDSSLAMLERHLGDFRLEGINPSRLGEFIEKRAAGGAGGTTIGIDLAYLGTVMRWGRAVRRYRVPLQPVQDAREAMKHAGLDTRSEERDRRPTQAEIDALIQHWESNPWQQIPMPEIVRFAIATAMRQGEICRLQWADLDENNKTILVRDRKDPRRKMGNTQRVPLLPATGYDAFEIVKRQPRDRGPRIFPYDSRSVSAAFTRACHKVGIKDLRFHDLRHEGASRLFEAGYSIEQVALVTGHKDWKQLRRYTQLRAEDLHR